MLIAVVIPAYNEEQYLGRCLAALAHQTCSVDRFEVTVVDNGSTDATAEIARRHRARLVVEPRKGVAHARQAGFEVARGEIIASTDADAVVPSFWVARIAAHFREDPALGGVHGPVRWYDGRPVDQWVQRYPIAWAQWLSHRAQRDLWWGSNFAVRREVFWKAGGFPLDWPRGEDNDLSLRVRRIARVRFDPDLAVYASSRRVQEGWFKLGRVALIDAVERFVLRRSPSQPMVDLR
jgi:glycosyltransferase involved in cell wall biosynthesis